MLTLNGLSQLTDQAREIACIAGARLIELHGCPSVQVSHKDDLSPVTCADREASDIIVTALEELEPSFPVLSEERIPPNRERSVWDTFWLVDPLDGTREFLKGNGEFTVNIALIQDGKPVLGVVLAPMLDLAYFAWQGGGAFRQHSSQTPEPISVRHADREDLTVACGRGNRNNVYLQWFLHSLGAHREISRGASLKSCLVAEGSADVYVRLGPTSEWDTAAAQVVVEEAGGHMTDTSMRQLRYNASESLVNPHFVVFGDDSVDWRSYLKSDDVSHNGSDELSVDLSGHHPGDHSGDTHALPALDDGRSSELLGYDE